MSDFIRASTIYRLDSKFLLNQSEKKWFWFETARLWVFRVLKYPKKCLEDLTTFFMSTWSGDSKNTEEIEFSRWLFEGRPRQCKNVLPDGLNWPCYFVGSSKSHRENSISFIFLKFPHQVDMKNVVKSSKHFFGYFNTLETHSGPPLSQILVSLRFYMTVSCEILTRSQHQNLFKP